MKLFLFFLLVLISYESYSQVSDSSKTEIKEATLSQSDSSGNSKKALEANDKDPEKEDNNYGLWLYILMPVILTFSSALYFISWLKKEGFRISNALSEDLSEQRLMQAQAIQKDMFMARATIIKSNATDPANAQEVPSMREIDQAIPMNRSSSRLIAFLSSMSASILAICLFSYYMYFALMDKTIPEFEDLWPILAALGMGVVPYATKVINTNQNG